MFTVYLRYAPPATTMVLQYACPGQYLIMWPQNFGSAYHNMQKHLLTIDFYFLQQVVYINNLSYRYEY